MLAVESECESQEKYKSCDLLNVAVHNLEPRNQSLDPACIRQF